MSAKKCQFEGCTHDAKKTWRYCNLHIQVMYRRMLNEGYLEPWPDGQEPDCPQDLIHERPEPRERDERETTAA